MIRRFGSDLQVCSFCKRTQEEVNRLIAGPDQVFICDECVDLCRDILEEDAPAPDAADFQLKRIPSPKEIYEQLNEWVVGQDRAKKVLSVAVYNHYKRINRNIQLGDSEVELQKSNILLIGPTGCGKTLLAQTLARILDVPFCITDATALTEAGYVGEDVENILLRLIQTADYDVQRAEQGIIYIDEIDKVARKSGDSPSITRDVSGEGVQQALLKIIEGVQANVPPQGGRKHPHQDFIQIDTTNILFICGGAFDNLDKSIEERLGVKGRMGFVKGKGKELSKPATPDVQKAVAVTVRSGHLQEVTGLSKEEQKRSKEQKDILYSAELLSQVTPDDLLAYGLIPEFVGRLPVIVSVEPLDHAAFMRILTDPRNAIVKQFQHLFVTVDNVDLVFTQEALSTAAEMALRHKTGARGLRAIIEEALLDVMYEIPSRKDIKKCIITADVIKGKARPELYDEYGRPVGITVDMDKAA